MLKDLLYARGLNAPGRLTATGSRAFTLCFVDQYCLRRVEGVDPFFLRSAHDYQPSKGGRAPASASLPWNFQAVTLSSPGRNFTQFPSKDDDGDLDDEVLLHGVKLFKKIKGPTYRARSPGVGECRPLRATCGMTFVVSHFDKAFAKKIDPGLVKVAHFAPPDRYRQSANC